MSNTSRARSKESFKPTSLSLETLGTLVAEKRGKVGVRATAAAIGISPATLSRIENGHVPDLANFRKICQWLEVDPAAILDIDIESMNRALVSVHFRGNTTIAPATSVALAEMIHAAHDALIAGDLD